ncbi:MAG TPA: hypothetical protein P5307_12620 [Pirellulaceae bacterium]|nr:hypothetical protein [Pirellulaceae bacterium]
MIPLWIHKISSELAFDGTRWYTECSPKSVRLFEQFFGVTGIPYTFDAPCVGQLCFELPQSTAISDPEDAEYRFRTSFQSFLLQQYGAVHPSECDGHLKLLHTGIPITDYSTTAPWHISRESLFEFIPKDRFTFSFADWPMLTFSLFGVRREFAFDFVTHPEQVLCKLVCTDHDPDSYLAFRDHFEEVFGVPDFEFELTTKWQDEQISIGCRVGTSNPFVADALREFQFYILSLLGLK